MSSPLALAVLTTGRQDWGVLRPLCSVLRDDQRFSLSLAVGGMACSEAFGRVSAAIREEGFAVAIEMPWDVEEADAAIQASAALRMTAAALAELRPDALVLLGDRFETAAAALAATLACVPIIHLYGGEETEGAFDNSFRHAITKMSHLHFVAHPVYADRVIQMGESTGSVHVVGSLGVDNLLTMNLPGREELERILGVELAEPVGLATLHPTTLSQPGKPDELTAVVSAIRSFPATWVVTLPNADPGSSAIRDAFRSLAADCPRVVTVAALGAERYLGLMKLAGFVLGNSSSGITEAPSLRVPTINVGERQKGRVRSPSIVDVNADVEAILRAIRLVLSPEWRARTLAQPLPFGDGKAAERIVAVLASWVPPRPPRKIFHSVGRHDLATRSFGGGEA